MDIQSVIQMLLGNNKQKPPFIPSIGRQGDFASPVPLYDSGRVSQFAQPMLAPEHRSIDKDEILHYLRTFGFRNN